jgi:hypothetical protein
VQGKNNRKIALQFCSFNIIMTLTWISLTLLLNYTRFKSPIRSTLVESRWCCCIWIIIVCASIYCHRLSTTIYTKSIWGWHEQHKVRNCSNISSTTIHPLPWNWNSRMAFILWDNFIRQGGKCIYNSPQLLTLKSQQKKLFI